MILRFPPTRRPPGKHAAFTLLELLVAASVLAIIMLLFSQLANLASDSWRGGIRRADNHAQARVILGLIERDVQSMVFRPELAAFVDQSQTPACAFYTSFEAPGGDRLLSLVSYSLEGGATPQLVRRDLGFDYGTEAGPAFGDTAKLEDLADAKAQILTENVVKFQVQFLDGAGTIKDTFTYNHADPQAAGNTRAVLVSMVSLDTSAMAMARKNGDLATITGKLSGTPAANQTYSDYWIGITQAAAFNSDIALPVKTGVRVFKREFNLPFAAVH